MNLGREDVQQVLESLSFEGMVDVVSRTQRTARWSTFLYRMQCFVRAGDTALHCGQHARLQHRMCAAVLNAQQASARLGEGGFCPEHIQITHTAITHAQLDGGGDAGDTYRKAVRCLTPPPPTTHTQLTSTLPNTLHSTA